MTPAGRLASLAVLLTALLGLSVHWATDGLPGPRNIRQTLWTRHPAGTEMTWIPLWSVSLEAQTAITVWEDPTFYHHGGLAYARMGRAVLINAMAGSYVRGASTITQQVAKNLFLSPEKTVRRKLMEAILARRLEQALSKAEILEVYLNIADWGDGIVGIETASVTYFNKRASQLTWADAAMLAGMLPNPRTRNPQTERTLAARYQLIVLDKLQRSGILTGVAFDSARSDAESAFRSNDTSTVSGSR